MLGDGKARNDTMNIISACVGTRGGTWSTPASKKEKRAKARVPNELPVGDAQVGGGGGGPGLESQGLSRFGDNRAIGDKLVDAFKTLPGIGVQIVVDAGLRSCARVATRGTLVNVNACSSNA